MEVNERAQNAADAIANNLNCMSLDAKQIAAAMMNQHRTLQQAFVRVAVEYLKLLLKTKRFDGRNEAAFKFAESIEGQLEKAYFPYI